MTHILLEEKGETFADVVLGEAPDRSFGRDLDFVSAFVKPQCAHTQIFSQSELESEVVWVDICAFQVLLCDLRWITWWKSNTDRFTKSYHNSEMNVLVKCETHTGFHQRQAVVS